MEVAPLFVLDTGPLFDHLALRYQEETGVRWLLDPFSQDPELQQGFARFLQANARRLIVTPGVVAEIQGHARRAEKKSVQPRFKRDFWRLVRNEFSALGIDERDQIPLANMPEGLLFRLGPVDVGVIELARSLVGGHRPVRVVTSDGGLLTACQEQEVPVRWYSDVP